MDKRDQVERAIDFIFSDLFEISEDKKQYWSEERAKLLRKYRATGNEKYGREKLLLDSSCKVGLKQEISDEDQSKIDFMAASGSVLASIKEIENSILYVRTGNPLFAWASISKWAKDCFEAGLDTDKPLPQLSPFCVMYLMEASHRLGLIGNLNGDVNEAEPPKSTPDISPTQALELVPRALGFTRNKGWSAFSDYRATKEKIRELEWFERLLRWGHTSTAAVEIIRSETGLEDVRSVRRRLAEAKKLRNSMPPMDAMPDSGFMNPNSELFDIGLEVWGEHVNFGDGDSP